MCVEVWPDVCGGVARCGVWRCGQMCVEVWSMCSTIAGRDFFFACSLVPVTDVSTDNSGLGGALHLVRVN